MLEPLLGIKDVRTSDNIDFVGGIRGISELEAKCNSGKFNAAFAMHPLAVSDLMAVADNNQIMPPKSTWFEPKPRSGFVVRRFYD